MVARTSLTWSGIDAVDFSKIYDENGRCHICKHGEHEHDCPGGVIDKLQWVATVPSFGSHAIGHGRTVDEAVELCVAECHQLPSASRMTIVCELGMGGDDINEDALQAMIMQCRQKQIQAEHEKALAVWQKELDELNAIASDFSEAGFAKRLAPIIARKPVLCYNKVFLYYNKVS